MRQSARTNPRVPVMLNKVPELANHAIKYMVGHQPEIREAVAVYSFLRKELEERGPATENQLFQFVYRSFYRMDNAGLLPNFHEEYFKVMEASRGGQGIDLKDLVGKKLYDGKFNRKGRPSLQFSFATKLAHTVWPDAYPIYDSEIARAFDFHQPESNKPEKRLEQCMEFYGDLKEVYQEILRRGTLREQIRVFCDDSASAAYELPDMKKLDFIFWSAGKRVKEEQRN